MALGYLLADPIVGLLISVALLRVVWTSAKEIGLRIMNGIEPERVEAIRHEARHVGVAPARRILRAMGDERLARGFLGATSLIVCVGLALQLGLSVTAEQGSGYFDGTGPRVANFFSYFTVLSNVLVALTTGMLAVRLDRRSTFFRVLRLDGLVGIAVTGVVFHLTLAQLQELTGWNAFADFLLHTASPILCVLGWLAFGPREALPRRVVLLGVIGPVLWLVYTLIRGPLVQDRNGADYYPYPFLNVPEHGYPVVLVNAALVAVLFLAISSAALALDRRLPGVRPARPPGRAGRWRLRRS